MGLCGHQRVCIEVRRVCAYARSSESFDNCAGWLNLKSEVLLVLMFGFWKLGRYMLDSHKFDKRNFAVFFQAVSIKYCGTQPPLLVGIRRKERGPPLPEHECS